MILHVFGQQIPCGLKKDYDIENIHGDIKKNYSKMIMKRAKVKMNKIFERKIVNIFSPI